MKLWLRMLSIVIVFSGMNYGTVLGQLHVLETKNMILISPSHSHDFIMPYMAQCFENALKYHKSLFNYIPTEQTTVFMQDFWDYGNAGATSIPKNYIRIGIAPLSYTYETSPANERINHTMNHEIAHVLASDKASANDNFYRKIFFGKVGVSSEDPLSMIYSSLTNPRRYSPRWYHEGMAVFMETWMAGGIGRAMGSYDEMVFRTMVKDSSYFYNVVGLESEGTAIDFQVGVNSYLYGTRFMSYLNYHYGPQKWLVWISNTENRKKFISADFKNVYGKDMAEEWSEWIEWEKKFQKENLGAIRLNPTTQFRPVSDRALGSVSRGYFDKENNKLYVAVLYPAQSPHIASIDLKSGEVKKLCEIDGAGLYYVTSLAFDPNNSKIYFSSDNGAWRDLNVIDLKTGESGLLAKDMRTGDIAYNKQDNSLWGIRHYNGISTIVRIPEPYTKWSQVYSWPYGKDMYDIDISPDGKLLTGALAEINGQQYLIKMHTDSLQAGKTTFDTLYNFDTSLPANFTFSPDGKFLYGSSYYSGVSNIFRYDLETDDIVALSNCESGFFRPVPVSDDSLIIFKYSGEGFVPGMISNQPVERVSAIKFLGNEIIKKYPQLRTWIAPSPSEINLDSLKIHEGEYNGLANMQLNSVYPIVQGYKNYAAAGLRFDVTDWVGFVSLTGKASYTPNESLPEEERVHASLDFGYMEWKLKATYNNADFYDLFGPTKVSRKGYSLGIQYNKSLLYEKPRYLDLNLSLTRYAELDRLPFFQKVSTPVREFITFAGSLDYSHLKRTLGAVEEEKGIEAEISTYNYYANSDLFLHLLVNFNYGFLLPIDHSSLWLRSSFGASKGDRDIAFSNYYFGGFGNNWIDDKNSQRYRESHTFPGVSLNKIAAQNYAKVLLEWQLPPIRFRKFGFTTFYLNWTRFSLFGSGMAKDLFSDKYKSNIANIGGQLDFKLVIFTYMSTTLSFGYANGFREGLRPSNEFMVSLKIL